MSKTNDFIERITDKLKHDRELRLDISHELQTHLDEAVEEYKASDYSDEDAIEAAIKDMGDAEELTDDLWQANKFRIKLRAWCWWIARLTLWPASVVLVLVFIILNSMVPRVLMGTYDLVEIERDQNGYNIRALASRYYRYRLMSQMSEDQKLIAFGKMDADNPVDRWKPLRDKFPDVPLYQLNYIQALFPSNGCGTNERKFDRQTVQTELIRGRELDPGNGIYDIYQAYAIMPEYNLKVDESRGFQVNNYGCDSKANHMKWIRPCRFHEPMSDTLKQQLLDCLDNALKHTYITDANFDFLKHRMNQLPPATTLQDYSIRMHEATRMRLSNLGRVRTLHRYYGVMALEYAEAGQADKAFELLGKIDQWVKHMASDCQTMIEIYTVRSVMQANQANLAFIHESLSLSEKYQQQVEAYKADQDQFYEEFRAHRITDRDHEVYRDAGILLGTTLPVIENFNVDKNPFRMVEYVNVDRLALTILNLGLVLIAGLYGLANAMRLLSSRTSQLRPILVWPGIGAFIKILFIGVAIPLLIFCVLSQTPVMRRQIGLGYTMTETIIWYVSLFECMLILIGHQTAEEIRKRCRCMGLAVPVSTKKLWLVLQLITLGLINLLIFLLIQHNKQLTRFFGSQVIVPEVLTVLLFILSLVYWFLLMRRVAWRFGIDHAIARSFKSLLFGFGGAVLLFALLGGAVAYVSPANDKTAMLVLIALVCYPLGLILSVFRLSGLRGKYTLYARSVSRMMPVVLIASAILLFLVVGQTLSIQEAHYTSQMVAQSPVFIDMEITQTFGKTLKERWSGDIPSPPSMIPNDYAM
jgi:hypothetical protein